MSVRAIFEHPTLRAPSPSTSTRSAPSVLSARPAANVEAAPRSGRATRSRSNQQQLLFFDQLNPAAPVYNAGSRDRGHGSVAPPRARDRGANGSSNGTRRCAPCSSGRDDIAEQVVLEQWDVELTFVDLGTGSRRRARRALHSLLRALAEAVRPRPATRCCGRLSSASTTRSTSSCSRRTTSPSTAGRSRSSSARCRRSTTHGRRAPPAAARAHASVSRFRLVAARAGAGDSDLEREAEFWRSRALPGAPTTLALPERSAPPAAQRFEGATQEVALEREVAQAVTRARPRRRRDAVHGARSPSSERCSIG